MMNKFSNNLKILWSDKWATSLVIVFAFFIFLGNQRISWIFYDVIIVLLLFLFFLKGKKIATHYNITFFILLLLLSVVLIFNIPINGFAIISLLKFYYFIKALVVIQFFNIMLRSNKLLLANTFIKAIIFLSIVQFIINSPVIYNQFISDPINFDEHNGLFGHGSSHFAGLVWLNICIYLLISHKYIFFVPILLLMIILSVFMEGKFFIYGAIGTVLIYFTQEFNFSKTFKFILSLLVAIPLLAFISNYLPDTTYSYNDYILRTKAIIMGRGFGSERASMLGIVLGFKEPYYFGYGVGSLSEIFAF